jgi:hypothetical protein
VLPQNSHDPAAYAGAASGVDVFVRRHTGLRFIPVIPALQ